MSAATLRVEASRERLRLAMAPPPPPARHDRAPARAGSFEALWRRLRAAPILNDIVESVGGWWSSHPLRPVGRVAGEASGAIVRPVAQRHPWMLVLSAAALGAGLAWARPWRWLFRSALFAGLAPQIASRVAANLPLESWLTMLGSTLSTRPAAPPRADAGADPLAS